MANQIHNKLLNDNVNKNNDLVININCLNINKLHLPALPTVGQNIQSMGPQQQPRPQYRPQYRQMTPRQPQHHSLMDPPLGPEH